MTVVVDTNIFIISLTSKSPFHRIYAALTNQQLTLAVSNEIILEYLEIIGKKYSQRVAHEFINLLAELPNVIFINIYYNWNLISADNDFQQMPSLGEMASVSPIMVLSDAII